MPRRFPARRTFSRAPRRATNWGRFVDVAQVTIAVSTKVLVATFTLNTAGIGETIIRTLGGIAVSTDNTSGNEDQLGAMGMIVVNDLAIAAGVASIPGPVTDSSDDGWFVWTPFCQRHLIGATVTSMVSQWYAFESKAARRVEEGFGIAIVVENASAANAFTVAMAKSILSKVNT